MKTYTTKYNALRAAKSAGFLKDQVQILENEVEGGFYFEPIQFGQLDASQALQDQAEDSSEPVPDTGNDDFHSVTEQQHAEHRGEIQAAPAEKKATPPRGANANASTIEKPCKQVWHIADAMFAANPEMKRKDVLARCVEAGIAFYTARTQYQQWLGIQREMAEREAEQKNK